MPTLLFFLSPDGIPASALLAGRYTPWLVALSVGMAVLAGVTALHIAGAARETQARWPRAAAIAAATLALGAGIWAMHFIGMLAFSICTQTRYHTLPTLLSMLPGLAAACIAVLLLARRETGPARLVLSGLAIGSGIAAMHYSGMAAMDIGPALFYDPAWFAFSLVAGVALSITAVLAPGALARMRWLAPGPARLAGGVVLGLAIACVHYAGMRAALFVGSEDEAFRNAAPPAALALTVAVVALASIGTAGGLWGLLHYRLLVDRLRSNERRLGLVIDGTVEGIVVLDAAGRITRFNRSAECATGLSAADMRGRPLRDLLLFPDEVLTAYLAHHPERHHTDGPAGVVREVVARRADGSGMPMRLSIGRVQVGEEKLFVAFVSDISRQKATEIALREREAQYGALIRNIPGAFFRLAAEPDRAALFMSEQVQSILGWPASDFTSGRRFLGLLVHPDDMPLARELVHGAIASPQRRDFRIECRMQHADGSYRWVAASCEVTLPDGEADRDGVPTIDGVLVDITETRLRGAEFEGTVRAIGHALAVVEFDVDARVLDANANFLAVSGYTLQELQGQHHSIFCDPAYVASPAYAEFWAALRRGEFRVGEYKRLGRDGRVIWVSASYNPVIDADGRLLKIVKFASDITARHAVQEAMQEAKERAEQSAAARTAFLANMSHEIRTPMNAVIGFTELLMDTPLSDLQRRHLETVRQSAGSLLGLLNDILDTAKLEKGAMSLEMREFSLRELTTQVTDSLRAAAQARNITLDLDYASDIGDFFRGDALRLRQVLVNLIGNGVKFTEHGGVRVHIGGDPAAGGATLLDIAVHDTGIGIPVDRLDTIFQPFGQADVSMSRRFGGSGLGITIARQLVELMGGSITVQSRAGEGSVFRVRLALEPATAPHAVARRAPEPEEGGLSVLVVDDVPQNAELLRLALDASGHAVTTACDGSSAVATWAGGRFDMVLMDVHMPGMDGLAATRRIRALENAAGRSRTPIMALTASVLESDRLAAREAGMDGFVPKPVDLQRLRDEMARISQLATRGDMPPAPAAHQGPAAAPVVPLPAGDKPALAAALDALRRGEIDAPALAAVTRALQARGDGSEALVLGEALRQFDLERAAALLAPLARAQEHMAA